MYSSLCRQLDETKKQKSDAQIEAGRKYASLESEHTKLQVEFYNIRSEVEKASASNR